MSDAVPLFSLLFSAAMQKMLSDSCAMSVLQEASDHRRQSLVSEACRRSNMHLYSHVSADHSTAALVCSKHRSFSSLETLDKKFDKMLSLQVLDKSKAIAEILQEVLGPDNGTDGGETRPQVTTACGLHRRRCRRRLSRPCSCRGTPSTHTSAVRFVPIG